MVTKKSRGSHELKRYNTLTENVNEAISKKETKQAKKKSVKTTKFSRQTWSYDTYYWVDLRKKP